MELVTNLQEVLSAVQDGREDALSFYAQLKELEKEIKDSLTIIDPIVEDESGAYSEKVFFDHGFQFEKRQGGKRFSFKGIPTWDEAEKFKKELEEKFRLAWLSREKGTVIYDDETGEEVPIPSVTYSKDSLIVKRQ